MCNLQLQTINNESIEKKFNEHIKSSIGNV